MRRRLYFLPLTAASLTVLAACNAIIGLSGDYDVGGGADGGKLEGDSGHIDANAADVITTTDGQTEPDGEVPDASVDQFVPTDAPYDALYPTAWDRTVLPVDASLNQVGGKFCDNYGAEYLCWDFTGADAVNSSFITPSTNGGMNTAVGDISTADRHDESTVTTDGGTPRGASLHFNRADGLATTKKVSVSFTFRIPTSTTARIMTVTALGQEYGLGVYGFPTCYGAPCIGEFGANAPLIATATPYDSSQWYRASIDLTHGADGTWNATITVGGHIIATRTTGDALPTTTGAITGFGVTMGAFDTQSIPGTATVDIDDVLMHVE